MKNTRRAFLCIIIWAISVVGVVAGLMWASRVLLEYIVHHLEAQVEARRPPHSQVLRILQFCLGWEAAPAPSSPVNTLPLLGRHIDAINKILHLREELRNLVRKSLWTWPEYSYVLACVIWVVGLMLLLGSWEEDHEKSDDDLKDFIPKEGLEDFNFEAYPDDCNEDLEDFIPTEGLEYFNFEAYLENCDEADPKDSDENLKDFIPTEDLEDFNFEAEHEDTDEANPKDTDEDLEDFLPKEGLEDFSFEADPEDSDKDLEDFIPTEGQDDFNF